MSLWLENIPIYLNLIIPVRKLIFTSQHLTIHIYPIPISNQCNVQMCRNNYRIRRGDYQCGTKVNRTFHSSNYCPSGTPNKSFYAKMLKFISSTSGNSNRISFGHNSFNFECKFLCHPTHSPTFPPKTSLLTSLNPHFAKFYVRKRIKIFDSKLWT